MTVKWKSGIEVKGLKMNNEKTKIMFAHNKVGRMEKQTALHVQKQQLQ